MWVDDDTSLLGGGYSDKQNTVAAALRTLGYTTGMTGKWHLTPIEEGGSFDSPYSKQTASVKEAGFDFVDGLYIENLCFFWLVQSQSGVDIGHGAQIHGQRDAQPAAVLFVLQPDPAARSISHGFAAWKECLV